MNPFAKPNLANDQLPSASLSDAGKALVLDENAVPRWGEVSGLPTVESTDKGKYLKANESTGEPEWDEVFFECTLTAKLNSVFQADTWEIDKTYSEIAEVIQSGNPVLVNIKKKQLNGNVLDVGYTFAYYYGFNSTLSANTIGMDVVGVDTSGEYIVILSASDVISVSRVSSVDEAKPLIIPLTISSGLYVNTSLTYASIKSAINAGRPVVLTYTNGGNTEVYYLDEYSAASNVSYGKYSFVGAHGSTYDGYALFMLSSGVQVYDYQTISLTKSKFIEKIENIQLTPSSGDYTGTSDVEVYSLSPLTNFYANYYDNGHNIKKKFSLVSFDAYGLSTVDIIIKDDSDGSLYKHTSGYYERTLSFTPYTP